MPSISSAMTAWSSPRTFHMSIQSIRSQSRGSSSYLSEQRTRKRFCGTIALPIMELQSRRWRMPKVLVAALLILVGPLLPVSAHAVESVQKVRIGFHSAIRYRQGKKVLCKSRARCRVYSNANCDRSASDTQWEYQLLHLSAVRHIGGCLGIASRRSDGLVQGYAVGSGYDERNQPSSESRRQKDRHLRSSLISLLFCPR